MTGQTILEKAAKELNRIDFYMLACEIVEKNSDLPRDGHFSFEVRRIANAITSELFRREPDSDGSEVDW